MKKKMPKRKKYYITKQVEAVSARAACELVGWDGIIEVYQEGKSTVERAADQEYPEER